MRMAWHGMVNGEDDDDDDDDDDNYRIGRAIVRTKRTRSFFFWYKCGL